MRAVVVILISLLVGASGVDAARAQQSNNCKQCSDQRKTCMSSYAGPTCQTEYDRCMKSCKKK